MTWAMPSRYSGGLWTLEFAGTSSFRAAEGICSLATRSLSPAYVEKAQIYLETVTSEDITLSIGCCEKLEDGWAPSAGKS